MSSHNNSFDFQKVLSGVQESGTRWIQGLGSIPTPANMNEAWQTMLKALSDEPAQLAAMQKRFVEEQQRLMKNFAEPPLAGSTGGLPMR